MGVQVSGGQGEINGHKRAMADFRQSHNANSTALVNHANGVAPDELNNPLPAYDPKHEDNQFPVMMYHPEKGERVIGQSLKGVSGVPERAAITAKNNKAVADAKKENWRAEPYIKPQVAVLDPAVEKKALMDQLAAQQGQNVLLLDMIAKLNARLEAVEKAA